MVNDAPNIFTVTLNPAVDRVVETPGLTLGAHAEVRTRYRLAAGKGVNVSRVLAAMGLPNTATGFLGRDNRDVFEQTLGEPVLAQFLLVPGSTRENLTLVDTDSGIETHLRDAGFSVTARDIRELTEQLLAAVEPGDQVIFCGSLPPGMSPGDFSDLVDACVQGEAVVSVDTSGEALRAIAHARLTLTAPNLDELSTLVGRTLPSRQEQLKAARGLAQRYGMVLLSAGSEGAYLVHRGGTLHARIADPPETVSTVGCGDVLLGRFLGQLNLGVDDDEALADAVSAATASAAGDRPADFDETLARTLLERIEVTEV